MSQNKEIVLEGFYTPLTIIISATVVSALHHIFKTTCFSVGVLSNSLKGGKSRMR